MQVRTVDRPTVYQLVSMCDAIEAVRDAFVDFELGHFEMPTRLSLGGGQCLIMPTYHRPTGSAVVKALSLNFDRTPAIAGSLIWLEGSDATSVVIDAEAVTTLRTGAAVGVATDLLASPHASSLTMFGAGAQAFHQVEAVNAVRPLTHVVVVDLDSSRASSLVHELSVALPNAVVRAESDGTKALHGADIVNCATTSQQALFAFDSLPPQVHVNAIGAFKPGMRELPEELLAAATIFVDDLTSALVESEEIIQALASGDIDPADLTSIGCALRVPVQSAARTVFKSVGIAPQDWAVAQLVALRSA